MAARLPRGILEKRLEADIDEHDEPYYGKSSRLEPYVMRSRAKVLNLRLRVLYADQGSCSTGIIRYLQSIKQPTVLACPIRGKQGGTRALCRGRKSYRTRYTFYDGTMADMVVVATLVQIHRVNDGANGTFL